MDEQQLIRAARKQDLSAFNRLILAYQGMAYNTAYRILGDGELAADACQEAFLSAFRAISSYRGGSFKSWLMRIVTNACYDQLRHKQRRPSESLDQLHRNPEEAPRLSSREEPPEAAAERRELSAALQHCLDRLSPDQRTVLVLCDVQGFRYEEIANIIGASLGTIKSRISRARAGMRECLQHHRELLPARYRLQVEEERQAASPPSAQRGEVPA